MATNPLSHKHSTHHLLSQIAEQLQEVICEVKDSKHQIKELSMKLSELAGITSAGLTQLNKSFNEIQTKLNELKAKIDELESGLGDVDVPQEVTDNLNQTKDLLQQLDDLVPDPTPVNGPNPNTGPVGAGSKQTPNMPVQATPTVDQQPGGRPKEPTPPQTMSKPEFKANR